MYFSTEEIDWLDKVFNFKLKAPNSYFFFHRNKSLQEMLKN